MILILIGLVFLAFGIYVWTEYNDGTSITICCSWICIFLVLAGLFSNIGGYKEPTVFSEQALYPLNNAVQESSADRDYFLIVEDGKIVKYTYCIKEDTSLISSTDVLYELVQREKDVKVVESNNPSLIEYSLKPKFNIFSFRLGCQKTEYVISVPRDGIYYKFNEGD
jgi:hypothetical protein